MWTQQACEIRRLHAELGTVCEEMEASAVARVCATFGAPVLFLKDVSNNELRARAPDAETGKGESILLGEIGRRAAFVAVATLALLGEADAQAKESSKCCPP